MASRYSPQSVKTTRTGTAPGSGEPGAREQVELFGETRVARLGSEPSQSPPSGQPPESRLPSKKSKQSYIMQLFKDMDLWRGFRL